MKIAIFNVLCKNKSTGKIAYNLYNYFKSLDNENECKIIYGRGKKYTDNKDFIKISSIVASGINYLKDCYLKKSESNPNKSTKKAIKILDDYKPDAVILLNLHGYYINDIKLLEYLKSKEIATVYFMCDEYPFLGKCTYSGECEKYLTECKECNLSKAKDFANHRFINKQNVYHNFNKLAFASVEYNIEKAKKSKLLHDKQLYVVDTGIDTDFYFPRKTLNLRQQLDIGNEKVCFLLVAPTSHRRKGTKYFLEVAELLQHDDRFVFVHVGYEGAKNKLPPNFIPIGYVENQEKLAEFYSLADCFVCTSISDSMPNTCLEALSCGTPICYFDISGMPFIANNPQGHKILEVSSVALSDYLQTVQPKTDEIIDLCRAYALARFSKTLFADKIFKIAEDMRNK